MTEVAPVLSSDKDDQYKFDKFDSNINQRSYLGPGSDNLQDRIRDYYSIDKLINYLKLKDNNGGNKFNSITLQFPDDLISDSAIIVQMLQQGLNLNNEVSFNKEDCTDDIETVVKICTDKKDGECTCDKKGKKTQEQKIWILADTSYSPCCIDEVAAEHVNSDIVIHFGDACLNLIEKLNSVYIFGKPYLNENELILKFIECYPDTNTKICLMSDAPYSYHLNKLYQHLKIKYKNLIYADIFNSNDSIILDHYLEKNNYNISNRSIFGLNEVENLDDTMLEYELFHLNKPQPPRLLELSTKFSTITIFDPITNETSNGPFPSLMKRYRFMHIARTASTIGILVNTLSLSNTKKMLFTVSKWIKDAGKKHYIFVVGKPNVAKLANFESIDIWCVLGCGQSGIIIDNVGDYYKPIITPYELQMALSDEVTWTGKWILDFKQVMEMGDNEEVDEEEVNEDKDKVDSDAPEFDVVTGQYVSTSRPLRRYVAHLDIEELDEPSEDNSLVKKFSNLLMIKGTVSTSALSLQKREWTGLGSDFADDIDVDGAVVEQGRGGVARGYDYDIETHK